MIKQSTKIIIAALFIVAISAGIYGCKKDSEVIPPERAFFVGAVVGNYEITSPTTTFKIPLGITTATNADRTINISVSSSTGAVAGTHYNIPTSFVIPAGKAIDTLVVAAVYNQYLAGRKDVLVLTLSGGDGVPPAIFNKSFTLNVKGPCFEGDVVLSDMTGDFEDSYDVTLDYGPYTMSVSNMVPTGPTSATFTVSNLYDWGWDDLNFSVDFSNAANPVISFAPQPTGFDAGNLNATVAGHELWISPPTGGASMGTWSWCNKTITINYRRCIPTFGAGTTCFTGVITSQLGK